MPIPARFLSSLVINYPGVEEAGLKNINIQISKGKALGIIGETGCGKTTLGGYLIY